MQGEPSEPTQPDDTWILRFVGRHLLSLGFFRAAVILVLVISVLSVAVTGLAMLTFTTDPDRIRRGLTISGVCILSTLPPTVYLVLSLLFRLEAARLRLRDLAERDELTGVANRRYFFQIADREVKLAQRHGHPASLLMIDADYFKKVNDVYGHPAGDAVLVALAKAIGDSLRGTDVVARYGGEEFTVLLSQTEPANAFDVAERIRKNVAARFVEWGDDKLKFTVSIGVANLSPRHPNVDALLADADEALYLAKEQGRNRVAVAAARSASAADAVAGAKLGVPATAKA